MTQPSPTNLPPLIVADSSYGWSVVAHAATIGQMLTEEQAALVIHRSNTQPGLLAVLKASDHWLKESLKYIDAADREHVRKQLILNERVFAAAEKGVA